MDGFWDVYPLNFGLSGTLFFEPMRLDEAHLPTVRFLIHGIFNYMGLLIHGRPEPPPGPAGQVQDLQEHLRDVQEHLQDHF